MYKLHISEHKVFSYVPFRFEDQNLSLARGRKCGKANMILHKPYLLGLLILVNFSALKNVRTAAPIIFSRQNKVI